MTDVAKLQLIEAYHKGTLTNKEQQKIEELQASDATFSEDLEEYVFLLDGFDMLALERFEDNVNSWEAKYQESENSCLTKETPIAVKIAKRRHWIRYISIAAAVALLFSVSIAYYSVTTPTDLYAQMYEPPTAFVVRGHVKEAQEQAYNFALSTYNKKDYAQAIELLNNYIDQYGEEAYEAIFYLASAQMASEKYEAALINFELVAENLSGRSFYKQQCDWYLLLIQYRLGNEKLAKTFANRIMADDKHNFKKKASEFLEKL